MELRDFDHRLEIARRTLDSRREYVELARVRFEGGLTSEVDWRQAQAEFYRTEAFVHDFERLVAQKENEISLLLGRNPGAILRGRTLEEQPVPPAIPPGLPSALLERRPDIRQAEQDVAAASASIGEAKAQLFPRIALTASYGFASTELDQLLDASSQSGSIFAGLLQPIFNAGKNRRRVEVRESQFRQAVTSYELTILRAFREVEDSLVAHRKSGDQLLSQRERVQAERKVLELAELRYRGGVAPYLDVLDAQRALFNAEIELTQVTSDRLVSLVRLYKALGGGWSADLQAPPTAPAEGGKPGN
jgi:multidrug efflux system outer membrane protein